LEQGEAGTLAALKQRRNIAPALRRAIAEVKKGRLALIDTVTSTPCT
jgi:hypothetical protein